MAINLRVDVNLIEKLMAINPSLITKDQSSGKLKFRHGALGRYIARLVREDLNKRTGETSELETFIKKATESRELLDNPTESAVLDRGTIEAGGESSMHGRGFEDKEG